MRNAVAGVLLLLMPPLRTPYITSIAPNSGRPNGGEIVRINGGNFRGPVRVLFEIPNEQLPREAIVVALTEQLVEVVTPSIPLIVGQEIAATVHVVTEAGTANESRATAPGAFVYSNVRLTPDIFTVMPPAGPLEGGTRITITGQGFQAPVQVLFGSVELRVIDVTFSQIVVETPRAADVGVTAGEAVDLTVVNINSNTWATLDDAFRYFAPMTITDITPRIGPKQGNADIRIFGSGFTVPVAVTVADMPVQLLFVSNTEIRVRTMPVNDRTCADRSGPVRVTNLATGDSAFGPSYTYLATPPRIIRIEPTVATIGSRLDVTLSNAVIPPATVTLGDQSLVPAITGSILSFVVPKIAFPTTACSTDGIAGLLPQPAILDLGVRYGDSCSDLVKAAVTIVPQNTICTLPPAATVIVPGSGPCLRFGRTSVPRIATLSLLNRSTRGTAPLVVTGFAVSGPEAAEFELRPVRELTAEAGKRIDFTVTFKAHKPGQNNATAVFQTNDPEHPVIEVCLRATVP